MNKHKVLDCLKDGDAVTFDLDKVSVTAFKSRCCEENKKIGYHRFSISRNTLMNTFSIKANGRK